MLDPHAILNLLNELATRYPLDWLVAAGVLSPLAYAVAKWRLWRNIDSLFQKSWFRMLFVMLAVGGWSLLDYVLHHNGSDPALIAVQASITYVTTQPIYLLVKGAVAYVFLPQLAVLREKWQQAKQLNAQKLELDIKAAAVPERVEP